MTPNPRAMKTKIETGDIVTRWLRFSWADREWWIYDHAKEFRGRIVLDSAEWRFFLPEKVNYASMGIQADLLHNIVKFMTRLNKKIGVRR